MPSLSHTAESRNLHLEFSTQDQRQTIEMGFGRYLFTTSSVNYARPAFLESCSIFLAFNYTLPLSRYSSAI